MGLLDDLRAEKAALERSEAEPPPEGIGSRLTCGCVIDTQHNQPLRLCEEIRAKMETAKSYDWRMRVYFHHFDGWQERLLVQARGRAAEGE